MGFFDTLSRRDKPVLFPERQTLGELALSVVASEDIAKELGTTNSKEICAIPIDQSIVEHINEGNYSVQQVPPLCFYNGRLCYLLKDEQKLYDLLKEIEQLKPQPKIRENRPAPVATDREALEEKIRPAEKEQKKAEILARMGLAEDLTDRPPTDIENEWSEEKLTEQLEEIESDIRYTDELLAGDQTPTEEEDAGKKKRKKRKSLGRNNQIMTRLTDSELVKFQSRVKKSGLPQGEYLRSAALTGKIIIEERNVADVAMLDELAMIRAELGRQGGLLKMVIKPNEGQRELAPDEWAALIAAVKDLESMKERVHKLEVIVNGDSKTPVK